GLLLRGGGGGAFRGRALGGLLLFLLRLLLGRDLDDAHLRQAERAAAVLPALLVLQHLDALAARQHVAGAGQRVLPAEALVNGHRRGPLSLVPCPLSLVGTVESIEVRRDIIVLPRT